MNIVEVLMNITLSAWWLLGYFDPILFYTFSQEEQYEV